MSHMRKRWEDERWDGCRGLTNRIIDIAADLRFPRLGYSHPLKRAYRRFIVSSRKRTELFGNPGSDHFVGNTDADAVDFRFLRTKVRYRKMNAIMARLGHEDVEDFGAYVVEHNHMKFRVQPIAALHGTGPHVHFGVKRIRG